MFKTSTLIVVIEELKPNKVSYSSKSDIANRIYRHHIPVTSRFPFEKLREGNTYALICVAIDDSWHWYIAFNISAHDTLIDESISL